MLQKPLQPELFLPSLLLVLQPKLLFPSRAQALFPCSELTFPFLFSDDTIVYKVQNLQWTADFSGDVTLTWARPKRMSSTSCVYNIYYRYTVPHLLLFQVKGTSMGTGVPGFTAENCTESGLKHPELLNPVLLGKSNIW